MLLASEHAHIQFGARVLAIMQESTTLYVLLALLVRLITVDAAFKFWVITLN